LGDSCMKIQSAQDVALRTIYYPDPLKLTQEQRELLERVPINLTRMLLNCSVPMVQSFLDFALSFRMGNLEPKLKELVILRMVTLNASSYELMHHLPAAKMVGWKEMEISAITSAQPSGLDQNYTVMIQLVDDCSQLRRVSDSIFEKASKIFSTSEIAEATLLAGLYGMLACFLKTMGVELDQHPLSWSEVDAHVGR